MGVALLSLTVRTHAHARRLDAIGRDRSDAIDYILIFVSRYLEIDQKSPCFFFSALRFHFASALKALLLVPNTSSKSSSDRYCSFIVTSKSSGRFAFARMPSYSKMCTGGRVKL